MKLSNLLHPLRVWSEALDARGGVPFVRWTFHFGTNNHDFDFCLMIGHWSSYRKFGPHFLRGARSVTTVEWGWLTAKYTKNGASPEHV